LARQLALGEIDDHGTGVRPDAWRTGRSDLMVATAGGDQQKLPAIYEYDCLVRDGGLMSYGPDMSEVYDRAADLADRILKGARPADLPFEQPTHFRLVINKKTLESLGLTMPPAMLMRADEVVD
jgi:ABC-type uncharacterized transport system substrate-binding protein